LIELFYYGIITKVWKWGGNLGRTIAVANQKGGVGKTTTAVNLSACLAQMGRKTLIVDMDPQGTTTSGLGVDKGKLVKTVYNVLLGECFITDVLKDTPIPGLTLAPADMALAGAEIELVVAGSREHILGKILRDIKYTYDYVIIDCPPSLNILTVNALTATDTVLVPLQCEFYALEGLTQLFHTVDLIKKRLNSRLKVEGIVFTMYDGRTNLSLQVVDEVKRFVPPEIYKHIIPRNVRLSEAPSHGLPITLYDRSSRGADAYIQLAEIVDENDSL